MKISTRSPKTLTVRGDDGTEVTIDVGNLQMTADQTGAFDKFIASGDLGALTQDERDALKNLKARIGGAGGPQALICRFDLTWVRID